MEIKFYSVRAKGKDRMKKDFLNPECLLSTTSQCAV